MKEHRPTSLGNPRRAGYDSPMKALLLSPYHTSSHSAWCSRLISGFPEIQWTLLSLPPRNFSWRIRGNALSWYALEKEILKQNYSILLATSMTDLCSLLGLFPHLQAAKTLLYFHENQFAYPLSVRKKESNVESMMVQIYSAMTADEIIFNSQYNRDTFINGARQLLKRIGDHSPPSLLDPLEKKTHLLPVPIGDTPLNRTEKIPRSILWNHRWEYDKNPEDFLSALRILKERDQDFKLILMGLQFRQIPEEFHIIRREFSKELLCWGEQSQEDYQSWLSKAQFVLSTARHEFQGLAVMEAVQQGAIPLVPRRLSYPQWFPQEFLYGDQPQELVEALIHRFNTPGKAPVLKGLNWADLKQEYQNLLLDK